jgi:uncharacterized protein YcgI (DUF1989 family)
MAVKAQPEARSSILSGWARHGSRCALRRVMRAYDVKAGAYVQIIDVEGKECSC